MFNASAVYVSDHLSRYLCAVGSFSSGTVTNQNASQAVRTSTVPFTSLSASLAAAAAQHNGNIISSVSYLTHVSTILNIHAVTCEVPVQTMSLGCSSCVVMVSS